MAPQKPLSLPGRQRALCAMVTTLLLLAAVSGCNRGTRRSVELLESRIRNQEETIASLHRNVSTLEAEREATQREADALRAAAKSQNKPVLLAEQAETQFRVSDVSINTYLSGGLDRDGKHGDELLTVLVVPQDKAGDTLRATGKLEIDVVDFAAPTGQQRIGHWDFDRNQTRELWHFGLIGRGIQITVPWQTPPVSETVTVHARLTMSDGRQFNAIEELRVASFESSRPTSATGLLPVPSPDVGSPNEPPAVEPVPSAFPPIESAEPTTIESAAPVLDSGAPGFVPAVSEQPFSKGAANLQPAPAEFEVRRAISLTARAWQSTAD